MQIEILYICPCGREWKELINKEIIDKFGTKFFCTCAACNAKTTVTVPAALTPPLRINEIFLENFVSNLFEMCKRLKHFEYSIFSKNGETFFMTEHKTLYSWVKDFMFENYF